MNFDDLKKYFTRDKMIRDSLVGLIFLSAGMIILAVFFLLSAIPAKGGDIYYFLQNAGMFFLFVSLFLTYAAIHRGNVASGKHTFKSLILATARQAHIAICILLGSILAILIVALVELLLSLIGYIPYAGPAVMGLLSLPLFVINFAVITAALLIWVVTPPMVGEDVEIKRMPFDFLALVKRRGLVIIGYTFAAVVVLVVFFSPVLMIIRYAAGITKSVQWNISPAYPQILSSIIRPSYITDIIGKIAPRTDPIAALQQYGSDIFNYAGMLGTLLKVLYGMAMIVLVSFVLSMFFNILSFCYERVKKGVLK
jgi:hypothetical protein